VVIAIGGREYRYVLPVIPLMAAASGYILEKIPGQYRAGLAIAAIGQIAWSLWLTERYAWQNWGEIMTPF